MCEAHAYLIKNKIEEKILENVEQIDFEGDEVRMINIFGERKTLKARLKSYNSNDGRILFKTLE